MELTIEKLIYGGDGLARIPSGERHKAVFLPFVLPGERVSATLTEEKPGFARARLDEVLASSKERIEPACPYFFRCGGCHYQHTSYERQLEYKAEIQHETIRRVAKVDLPAPLVHASEPWNYRNRTRMKVRNTPEFAMGYFRFASHELLPVEACPISSPLINRAIAALWELGRRGALRGVNEVECFTDAEDACLLIELYTDKQPAELKRAAEHVRQALPEVAGVWGFRADARGFTVDSKLLYGEPALTYRTARGQYRVSGGSFFQVNRSLVDTLVGLVCDDQKGESALDLYAGAGLFTLPLSRSFGRVTAVEAAPSAAGDLAANVPPHAVKAVRATTEEYLGKVGKKQQPDFIVVDPPRGGLGTKAAAAMAAMQAPRVTYVSCDPATLARDLHTILAAGYSVEKLHMVDLFPQTFHIESVVQLVRA